MIRLIITLPKFKYNILNSYLPIQLPVCTIIYGHSVLSRYVQSMEGLVEALFFVLVDKRQYYMQNFSYQFHKDFTYMII